MVSVTRISHNLFLILVDRRNFNCSIQRTTDLSCESNNKSGEFLLFLGFGVFLSLPNDSPNSFAEKSNDMVLNVLLLLIATGADK